MFVIIGYIVVVASVIGGYAMAGGHVSALFQPLELLMIGGAAFGAFIVANPGKDLKACMAALPSVFKGSKYTKERYLSVMAMLYDILSKARKEGLMAIENDVEQPESSPLFTRYPDLLADHHLIEFVTDYLRMMISGNLNARTSWTMKWRPTITRRWCRPIPSRRWPTAFRPSGSWRR